MAVFCSLESCLTLKQAVFCSLETSLVEQEVKKKFLPLVEASHPLDETKEVDLQPHTPESDNYTHNLKDFRSFTGCTYEDILSEIRKWLEPLLAQPDLQTAFLDFINHCKSLNTYRNLQTLSKYLKQLGDALRTDRNPLPNQNTELTPVLQALGDSLENKLDQIAALILAAEACSAFPQHTLQKMFALDQEKRSTVLRLVKTTPCGTNRHAFIDEGPFKDPVLCPILRKIGYSCPDQHLIYIADDLESDMPAAASTVIMIAPPLAAST